MATPVFQDQIPGELPTSGKPVVVSPNELPLNRSSKAWPAIVLAIVAVIVAVLTYIACFTQLEYFDTYDLLCNAKRIAYHARQLEWRLGRPPLTSLLFVPNYLIERLTGIEDLGVRLGHLFGVASFVLLLWATFRLLRRELDPWLAWLGVAWTALNPLLLHYAPMGKEDILTTVLIILTFDRYLAACESRRARDYYLAGFLCGLGMSMKFNLIPLLMGTMAAYELVAGYTRFRRGEMITTKLLALLVLPVCMFWVFPMITFKLAGRSTVWLAPSLLIADIQFLADDLKRFQEAPSQYYFFLIKAVSFPVVVLCFGGILLSLRKWRTPRRWAFYLLWLLIFFYFQAYFIGHKEARYLFVLYLPVYYFALVALKWLAERVLRSAPALRIAGLAALLVAPCWMTVRELSRFRDPVYWADFERETSRSAATLAGDHRLWWFGFYYPIYPEDYLFDIDDEFTSIYHMGAHVVELYTNKSVPYLEFFVKGPGEPEWILYDNPQIAAQLSDGDVMICNPAKFVDTQHMEERRTPLLAESVRVIELKPEFEANPASTATTTTPSTTTLFRSAGNDAIVRLMRTPNEYYANIETSPDGPAVLVLRSNQRPILGAVPIIVSGGKASRGFTIEGKSPNVTIDGFAIVRPDRVQEFNLPAPPSALPLLRSKEATDLMNPDARPLPGR